MINISALYRLSRTRKPGPDEVRSWREGLGLSVTGAGRALNLSNPNGAVRQYEREGSDRCPAPPTVAYMDTITLMTLALLAMREGNYHRAQEHLIEAMPEAVLKSLYDHARFPK